MDELFKKKLDEKFKRNFELNGHYHEKTSFLAEELGLSKDVNLEDMLTPYFSDESCEYSAEYPYNEIDVTLKIWISKKEYWTQGKFIKWYHEEYKGRDHSDKSNRSLKPKINEYSKVGKISKDELTKYLDKELEQIM